MAGYRGWQGKKIGLFEPRFDGFWRAVDKEFTLSRLFALFNY